MIGGVDVAKGAGAIQVVNGTLTTYLSNSGTIDANTFIQIVNGKVEVATTQIDGVTVSKCTTTRAGKVYVL